MKKISVLLFLLPLLSCGRIEITPPTGDSNAVCLSHTKAAGSRAATFSFVREGDLVKVRHDGIKFNCGCEEYGITVRPVVDGHDLYLMEIENDLSLNCLCEMEVYLEIENLPADTYVVHIAYGNGEDRVPPFDMNFSKDSGAARFSKPE